MKKRSDGRYQMFISLGTDETGKRKSTVVYGKTQKEVKDKATQLKIRIGKGLDILGSDITFGKLQKYWEIYKEPLLREQQLKDYIVTLRPFEPLKDRRIVDLIQSDFQTIINDYAKCNPHTGKPTAKATLRNYRMAARQVMEYAVENRLIEYNPVTYVRIPKNAPKGNRRALSEQEQQWIINTEHRAQLPAMLMMLAGLRLEECLALQWRDIDLRSATIRVHQKLIYKEYPVRIEQGAKTEAGIRTVNIPKILVNYLKAQPKTSPEEFVCTNAGGKLYSATSWRTAWNSFLLTLNLKYGDFSMYEKQYKSKYDPSGVPFVIKRFTAHCLRHTHATNLFHCGKDILYVQHQLGHSSPDVTLTIYTHLVEDHTISRTNKVISIDKYLERIGKENNKTLHA